jgi:hypothetical protein
MDKCLEYTLDPDEATPLSPRGPLCFVEANTSAARCEARDWSVVVFRCASVGQSLGHSRGPKLHE